MAQSTLQTAKFLGDVSRRSGLALKSAVLLLLGNIKALLTNSAGGRGRRYDFYKGHLWPIDTTIRFYTKGGKVRPWPEPKGGWKVRGRIHQSSADGQSPRLLTGALARTMTHTLAIESGGDVVAFIGPSGPSVKYARWLEETMNRPYAKSTLERSWDSMLTRYREVYARAG